MDDDALREYGQKVSERTALLMQQNPTLHYITATIIAGDLISADAVTDAVAKGEITAVDALVRIGSYARFDWAVGAMGAGYLSTDDFYSRLPSLWRGSDPDDTQPNYLNLWHEAWVRNGCRTVCDGPPLRALGNPLIVYRGGDPFTVKKGIAWTLNPKVARSFANGAGERIPRNGVVIKGEVDRFDILAYLTGRKESEVIIDPRKVRNIHATGAGL
jgi:hypothetical protein